MTLMVVIVLARSQQTAIVMQQIPHVLFVGMVQRMGLKAVMMQTRGEEMAVRVPASWKVTLFVLELEQIHALFVATEVLTCLKVVTMELEVQEMDVVLTVRLKLQTDIVMLLKPHVLFVEMVQRMALKLAMIPTREAGTDAQVHAKLRPS